MQQLLTFPKHCRRLWIFLCLLALQPLFINCKSGKPAGGLFNNQQKKEVFVFSTTNKNYKYYDWKKITTLVECGYHDPHLVEYAHSMNASVVFLANFKSSMLYSKEAMNRWVDEQVSYFEEKGLDGVNVDYEGEMNCTDSAAREGYNYLMRILTERFKWHSPLAQVSIDFAWSPENIDNRCYDYKTLGHTVDFSFLMMYNLRSQVSPDLPCLAWANAAYNGTLQGLKQFQALGIPNAKLVFGVPWFGFNYECEHYDTQRDECRIKSVPFRGCNCSDAAGPEQGYSTIRHLAETQQLIEPHVMWDPIARSPYFSYKAKDGRIHQVWYDDAESLQHKYLLAQEEGLRGVGMWQADSLNYTDTPEMRGYVRDMWDSLPSPSQHSSSEV